MDSAVSSSGPGRQVGHYADNRVLLNEQEDTASTGAICLVCLLISNVPFWDLSQKCHPWLLGRIFPSRCHCFAASRESFWKQQEQPFMYQISQAEVTVPSIWVIAGSAYGAFSLVLLINRTQFLKAIRATNRVHSLRFAGPPALEQHLSRVLRLYSLV